MEQNGEEKARLCAIAAIGENRELGKAGNLIWRIPEDLKRLKALTLGHPLIMGRKTYESIGKPLPGRMNIVVSGNADFEAPGCTVASSLPDALEIAHKDDREEIFIFGGASLYESALPFTDRLYLTLVHDTDPDADVFFPEYSDFTIVVEKETRDHDGLAYEWLTLER